MSLIWNSSKQSSAASAVGEGGDRVVCGRVGPFPGVDAGVRLLHEGVEMDAAPAADGGVGVEQIHEHGFAAADVADEVEAAGLLAGFLDGAAAEQAADEAAFRARGRRVVAAQLDPEVLQALGSEGLGVVGREFARGHHRAVGGERPLCGGYNIVRCRHVHAAMRHTAGRLP